MTHSPFNREGTEYAHDFTRTVLHSLTRQTSSTNSGSFATLSSRIAAISWPAFLVAAVLEIGVFAFVDPNTLHTLSGAALEWSETAVYSLAFFAFWVVIALAAGISQLLAEPAVEEPAVAAEADAPAQG